MAEAYLYAVEHLPRMLSLRAMAVSFSWRRQRPEFPEESMSAGGNPGTLPMHCGFAID
jgi:hypothetical protein